MVFSISAWILNAADNDDVISTMDNSLRVIKVLKNDPSGMVASVWHEDLSKTVVMKAVPLSDIALREVQILKELNHPSIPALIDSYTECDTVYMILEYRKGQTLLDLCESRKLTEKDVIQIIRQLVSIISYLHTEAKIVHRDIKLENVIVDEKYNVSLIDFGFADHLKETMTERLGSPVYCSPEIICGRPYGLATDIWSLGVLIYYLLQKKFPFEGETIEIVFNAVCSKQAPISGIAGISPNCVNFLSNVLRKDQDQRLTIDQVIEHPWLTTEPQIKSMASGNLSLMYKKCVPVFKPRVSRIVLGRLLAYSK